MALNVPVSSLDAIPLFGGGFIAVAQLAGHHGILASPAQLSHQSGLGELPPTAEDLARAAISVGLKARVLRNPTAKRLKSIPVPAIIKVKDGTWAVFGAETEPGVHRIIDPVTRRQTQVPLAEMLKRLDHDVILISRTAVATTDQRKFGLAWFFPAIRRYRRPLTDVLLTSFLINLLGLATPLVFQLVVDKVLVSKSYSTLVVVISAMVLISVFSGLLKYLRSYVLTHTSSRIDAELGAKLFSHLIRLTASFFERRPTGVIVTRARELDTIRRFLTNQSLTSVVDLLFVFLFIGVLMLYSKSLTLMIVLLMPVYFVISVFMKPLYRKSLKDKFLRWSKAQQHLVETVVGIQTIKASAVEPNFQKMWEDRHAAYAKAGFRSTMLGTVTQTLIQFVTTLQTALILFFGAQQVIAGTLTVGGLIAFSMIGQRMTKTILSSAQLYQSFQEVQVSLGHLADILDEPVERQPHAMQALAGPERVHPAPQRLVPLPARTPRSAAPDRPRHRARRGDRHRRPERIGQVDADEARAALPCPERRRDPGRRRRHRARPTRPGCGVSSAWCCRRISCSTRPSTRTSPWPTPACRGPGSSAWPSSPAPTSSSPSCRKATTPPSRSAARTCRGGSASGSPSRARSRPTRGS